MLVCIVGSAGSALDLFQDIEAGEGEGTGGQSRCPKAAEDANTRAGRFGSNVRCYLRRPDRRRYAVHPERGNNRDSNPALLWKKTTII